MNACKIVTTNKDACVSSIAVGANCDKSNECAMNDQDGGHFGDGYFEKRTISSSIKDSGESNLPHTNRSAINHERRDVNSMVDGVNNYGGGRSGVDNKYDICDVCAKTEKEGVAEIAVVVVADSVDCGTVLNNVDVDSDCVVRCIEAANSGLPMFAELSGVGDNLQHSESKNDCVDVIANCSMPHTNVNYVAPKLVVSKGNEICTIKSAEENVYSKGKNSESQYRRLPDSLHGADWLHTDWPSPGSEPIMWVTMFTVPCTLLTSAVAHKSRVI